MCVFALVLRSAPSKHLWLIFAVAIFLCLANISAFMNSGATFVSMQRAHLAQSTRVAMASTVEASVDKKIDDNGKKKKRRSGDVGAMEVVVLGLSHHNAAVDVREKLAISEANWNDAAAKLCEFDGFCDVRSERIVRWIFCDKSTGLNFGGRKKRPPNLVRAE